MTSNKKKQNTDIGIIDKKLHSLETRSQQLVPQKIILANVKTVPTPAITLTFDACADGETFNFFDYTTLIEQREKDGLIVKGENLTALCRIHSMHSYINAPTIISYVNALNSIIKNKLTVDQLRNITKQDGIHLKAVVPTYEEIKKCDPFVDSSMDPYTVSQNQAKTLLFFAICAGKSKPQVFEEFKARRMKVYGPLIGTNHESTFTIMCKEFEQNKHIRVMVYEIVKAMQKSFISKEYLPAVDATLNIWYGAFMAHIMIIIDEIFNERIYIACHPYLRREVSLFSKVLGELLPDPEFGYIRIRMTDNPLAALSQREVPLLFGLAVHFRCAKYPSMSQYRGAELVGEQKTRQLELIEFDKQFMVGVNKSFRHTNSDGKGEEDEDEEF